MKGDRDHDLPSGFEQQWKDWASSETEIDGDRLRRDLLERISEPSPSPRMRLVFAAAAASVLAMIIGIGSLRRPPATSTADDAIVHDAGANVILVLREGKEPIYIATERSDGEGVRE